MEIRIIITAIAGNCGASSSTIIPQNWTGIVRSNPVTKIVLTNSSNDKLNENRIVAIIPGLIIGIITLKKILNGLAPRSIAASSRDLSNPCILGYRVKKANGSTQFTWAINTVDHSEGRISEYPKKINKTIPPIIPGIIIGTKIRYKINCFPGKSCRNPIANNRARIVEIKAVQIPTPILLNKAFISSGLSNTKLYHLNEKPAKGNPTISELLKDKKVSINKGP